ncbi:MAG: hypothetical protein KJZ68_16330, partial [Phycisphaerales bacterium]|nr:hypothetical protein [Phycisphaerales bacterium]
VVMFGGVGSGGRQDDTWEWNGLRWVFRADDGPVSRRYHALAFDQARGRAVLFGGRDGFGRRRDTWVWDGRVVR